MSLQLQCFISTRLKASLYFQVPSLFFHSSCSVYLHSKELAATCPRPDPVNIDYILISKPQVQGNVAVPKSLWSGHSLNIAQRLKFKKLYFSV